MLKNKRIIRYRIGFGTSLRIRSFVRISITMTNTTQTMSIFDEYQVALNRGTFYLLLCLEIQALVLYIVIFVFVGNYRNVLRSAQNLSVFILLIPNFLQLLFNMPQTLHYLRLNYVSPATPSYCTFWTFCVFVFNAMSEFLMATISIQRHMLIFNSHMMRVRRKRIFLFHLPLIFCIIYPTIFDFVVVVLYPCDGSKWNYTSNVCGVMNCFLFNPILSLYNWIFNCGLPTIVNLISDIILFIRVLLQKRHVNQEVTWKQQRTMAFHLFSISGLYAISWIPVVIVGTMQTIHYSTLLANIRRNYITYFPNFVWFFLPWVIIGIWSELRQWIRKCFKYRRAVVSIETTLPLQKIRAPNFTKE